MNSQGGSSRIEIWLLAGVLALVALCSLGAFLVMESARQPDALPAPEAATLSAAPRALVDRDAWQEQVLWQGILVLSAVVALSVLFLVAALSVLSAQAARRAADEAAAARLYEERRLAEGQALLMAARADLLQAQRLAQREGPHPLPEEPVRVGTYTRRPARARRPVHERKQADASSITPARVVGSMPGMVRQAPLNGRDGRQWPPDAEEVDISNLPVAD